MNIRHNPSKGAWLLTPTPPETSEPVIAPEMKNKVGQKLRWQKHERVIQQLNIVGQPVKQLTMHASTAQSRYAVGDPNMKDQRSSKIRENRQEASSMARKSEE